MPGDLITSRTRLCSSLSSLAIRKTFSGTWTLDNNDLLNLNFDSFGRLYMILSPGFIVLTNSSSAIINLSIAGNCAAVSISCLLATYNCG